MGRKARKPKNRSQPTPIPTPPRAAASTPAPAVKRDQTFADALEVLDGNAYEGCTFARCRIVYKGGALPVLSRCVFDECSWDLDEAAHSTLSYLRGIYHGMGTDGRELVEQTFQTIREQPREGLAN